MNNQEWAQAVVKRLADTAEAHFKRNSLMNNPKQITIKVTDGEAHAYFVHFDRETHALVDVFEYKKIYAPLVGVMPRRTKIIVDLAKSRIGMPLETVGDNT
jgi:hypothetical protein